PGERRLDSRSWTRGKAPVPEPGRGRGRSGASGVGCATVDARGAARVSGARLRRPVAGPSEPEPGDAGGGKQRPEPSGPVLRPRRSTVSGRAKLSVDAERLAGITTGPWPASRKGYLQGTLHPEVRAPYREISLQPTRLHRGDTWTETPN